MQRDLGNALDIVLACRDIEEFVSGFSKVDFFNSKLTQDAVIRNIAVIGEAAKRLSEEFRNQHSEIPWKSIAGMRDHLIHAYDQVDLERVWHVATEEAPALRRYLEPLLPPPE